MHTGSTLLEIQIIQNGHNKFKKNPNNENPSRGVIFCYIVERKNTRLGILIMFRKNLHKMTYHVRGFMAFGPNDRCYVLDHGIVCDVVPILCMCVDIVWRTMLQEEVFLFVARKSPFPFTERK